MHNIENYTLNLRTNAYTKSVAIWKNKMAGTNVVFSSRGR